MLHAQFRRPLVRAELLIGQCSWCGGIRVRGRYVRFVGAPVLTWLVSWRIGRVLRVRFGFTHGICPHCTDWRMAHELAIAALQRELAMVKECLAEMTSPTEGLPACSAK